MVDELKMFVLTVSGNMLSETIKGLFASGHLNLQGCVYITVLCCGQD